MKRQRPLVAADNPIMQYVQAIEAENDLMYKALALVKNSAAVDPSGTKSLVLLSSYARDILAIVDKMRTTSAKQKPEGRA